MAGIAVLTLLTISSVGFYSWFLLVHCKESKRRSTCYLVRLESKPNKDPIPEQSEPGESIPIAA